MDKYEYAGNSKRTKAADVIGTEIQKEREGEKINIKEER